MQVETEGRIGGLVLTRGVGESILIGDGEIVITVEENKGNKRVRLRIQASKDIPIRRAELPPLVRGKTTNEVAIDAGSIGPVRS